MNRIRKLLRREKGQALLEFAIVLPIFLLLFAGTIDYGWTSMAQIQVTNATQEATKYYATIDPSDMSDIEVNELLQTVVRQNINTVKGENIAVESYRPSPESVYVKVQAKVPSLTNMIFKNVVVTRELTMKSNH